MLLGRNRLEELEDKSLAPYATRCIHSRGRKFQETEPDYRTRFQRDRDRIIHTTAFRRLEYKTQVFFIGEGDYYRTRLTHTLEVSQIGRSIARSLGANEDLTEAICLAHDLGHPAFGHSGERTLAREMEDLGGFDHNRQSLRIVTELEHRFQDFPGLNLCYEVLEGIVKHETEYDRSDAQEYNPEKRGHLEAQIANAADELAFTAHDLDDGLRSQLVTPAMLEGIEIWELMLEEAGIRSREINDLHRHIIIRALIGMQMNDLLRNTDKSLYSQGIKTREEIQALPFNIVSFGEDFLRRNRQLKDFLYEKLYRHYMVVRMSIKADHILSGLFHAYCDEPAILPEHIKNFGQIYGKERAICDYIAGMTDRFAIEEHIRLFESDKLP